LELLSNPDVWVALLTLTALEIVLGIDNVIFISILADKLPPDQRRRARLVGLSLAMFMRIALLLTLNWIANLTNDLFTIAGKGFSGRDLILLAGGLFLIYKATTEIHTKLEGDEHHAQEGSVKYASFSGVIAQILLLDIVFSLDSVITAVGLAEDIEVMVAAVVIAVLVMLVASGPLSDFVSKHPTVKMLALSFLLLIGTSLVAEGWGLHISKGYIYAAMAFSVFVEILNLRMRGKSDEVVQLRDPERAHYEAELPAPGAVADH
jgi:predicted tellurium resistance membrane protein TerC